MQNFKEIQELMNSLEPDVTKFWKQGNASAGVRLRKGLLKIKQLAHAERIAANNGKRQTGKPINK